ncbi:MAG: type II toxin-antitoxin system HipA family toxin, partial [Haloechinothrix sp.]
MTDRLLVLIGDHVAGELTHGRGGRLAFSYDGDYRAQPEPTPLSLSMPVPIAQHTHRSVLPWLWGLLPDNDRVLQRWAQQFKVSASSPFGLLASPVGLDCAGAVRFVSESGLTDALDRPGSVTWLTETEVAERLRALQRDTTAWLGNDFTGHFSLAGAQAKTALVHDNGRWGLPEGSVGTSHILKPAIAGFDDHDLNEHICLRAASLVGLPVVRSELVRFGDQSAVVIERYDRTQGRDGTRLRVHQEDLCQALGRHPAAKYQAEGGPGPSDAAALFRQVMPDPVADAAIWRFADALVWNWVIAGTDAHAKNYSLLLHGGQVRLAPLYDIASTLPYAHERDVQMAMKLGGDYRLHVQRPSTWTTMATDLRLQPDALRERAARLVAAAPDAFGKAAA